MNQNHQTKNKGGLIVIISLAVIIVVMFALNSFLKSKNQNDVAAIQKPFNEAYTKGGKDAKLKLTEFADFECPACASFSKSFEEVYTYINQKYGDNAFSWTFKLFPLIQIHKNADLAARSANAALLQGKFWEYEKIIFSKQEEWTTSLDVKSTLENYATSLNLDLEKFKTDRDSEASKNFVSESLKEASKFSLNHTPTLFLNGVEWKDVSFSTSSLTKDIEDKLKELNVSPINK